MNSRNVIAVSTTVLCLGVAWPSAAQDQSTPSARTSPAESTSQWTASGFVGSNFANNASPASTNIGGSLAYLWNKQFGAELEMGFTPKFELQNNFFGLGVKPQVNTFMANAVWARPLGADGQWQPFVSGGLGALSLRSGITNVTGIAETFDANDTRFGGDVGAGFMGFSGRWGFKADVRYYRATGTYTAPTPASNPNPTTNPTPGNPSPAPGPYGVTTGAVTGVADAASIDSMGTSHALQSPASAALTGLHFWRANVGVAVRW